MLYAEWKFVPWCSSGKEAYIVTGISYTLVAKMCEDVAMPQMA